MSLCESEHVSTRACAPTTTNTHTHRSASVNPTSSPRGATTMITMAIMSTTTAVFHAYKQQSKQKHQQQQAPVVQHKHQHTKPAAAHHLSFLLLFSFVLFFRDNCTFLFGHFTSVFASRASTTHRHTHRHPQRHTKTQTQTHSHRYKHRHRQTRPCRWLRSLPRERGQSQQPRVGAAPAAAEEEE